MEGMLMDKTFFFLKYSFDGNSKVYLILRNVEFYYQRL